MLSALEDEDGLGCGRDQTTQDMVQVRGNKETAEEKAAKALKAKKNEDARAKKLAKKAATKAAAEQSLHAHQDSQRDMDENEQDIDPMQTQLVELREVIGGLKSKLIELEAKVDGQSAKIHALQMRHLATPDDPIDVDLEAVVDRETFCADAGKDNLRKLDSALMANYNAKHSNVRVSYFY